jgi:hypothetical protein
MVLIDRANGQSFDLFVDTSTPTRRFTADCEVRSEIGNSWQQFPLDPMARAEQVCGVMSGTQNRFSLTRTALRIRGRAKRTIPYQL